MPVSDPILAYLRENSQEGSQCGYIMQDGEWIPLEMFYHKVHAEMAYVVAGRERSGSWDGYEQFIEDYRPARVSCSTFLFTAPPTSKQLETAAKLTIKHVPNNRDVEIIVWGATSQRNGIYWGRKFEKLIGRKLCVSR